MMRKSLSLICLLVTVVFWPGPAGADVYKCKDADGKTTYSDAPCPAGASEAKPSIPKASPVDELYCLAAWLGERSHNVLEFGEQARATLDQWSSGEPPRAFRPERCSGAGYQAPRSIEAVVKNEWKAMTSLCDMTRKPGGIRAQYRGFDRKTLDEVTGHGTDLRDWLSETNEEASYRCQAFFKSYPTEAMLLQKGKVELAEARESHARYLERLNSPPRQPVHLPPASSESPQ